jgi:hypothetical protein
VTSYSTRVRLRELGNAQHKKAHSLFGGELEDTGDTVQQFRRCTRRIAALQTTVPVTTDTQGFGEFFLGYRASAAHRQAFPRAERRPLGGNVQPTCPQERSKLGLGPFGFRSRRSIP